LTQQEGRKGITLDDLLERVEAAARAIEHLRAANADLARQLRATEAAAQADAQDKSRKIEALEQELAALRHDAAWCRWFRNKYQDSTFYSHIERDFRKEYLGEDVSGEE